MYAHDEVGYMSVFVCVGLWLITYCAKRCSVRGDLVIPFLVTETRPPVIERDGPRCQLISNGVRRFDGIVLGRPTGWFLWLTRS